LCPVFDTGRKEVNLDDCGRESPGNHPAGPNRRPGAQPRTRHRLLSRRPYLFGAGQLSFFDRGGIRIRLDRRENKEFEHPGAILYFSVSDIQAARQRLLDAGVPIVEPPKIIAVMSRSRSPDLLLSATPKATSRHP
jgi:hypothetical protein